MLVLCFRNIIELVQSEIFLSLKQILEISIRIINDTSDVINTKSIEIESIIKNKIGIYFEHEKQNHQGGLTVLTTAVMTILEAIEGQSKKNMIIKEWSLSWFKFVMNLDIR